MKFEERKQPGRRDNKGPMPFSGIHLSQLTAARWVRALRGKLCGWCEPCLWKMPRFQWLLSAWSFSSWMEFCSYSAPQRRRSNLYLEHVTRQSSVWSGISSSSSRRKCDIAHTHALIHILTRAVVFSLRISPLPFLEFKAETPPRSIPSADTRTLGIHMKKIPRQGSVAGLKVMI